MESEFILADHKVFEICFGFVLKCLLNEQFRYVSQWSLAPIQCQWESQIWGMCEEGNFIPCKTSQLLYSMAMKTAWWWKTSIVITAWLQNSSGTRRPWYQALFWLDSAALLLYGLLCSDKTSLVFQLSQRAQSSILCGKGKCVP